MVTSVDQMCKVDRYNGMDYCPFAFDEDWFDFPTKPGSIAEQKAEQALMKKEHACCTMQLRQGQSISCLPTESPPHLRSELELTM